MSDTITITGNVATVPERKRMADGGAITTFRLASGHRQFDKATSRWVDGETNWYSVSVFRRLGEHAFDSLQKGERVLVTGRLRLREWESGAKKGWTAEINADAIGHDLLFGTTQFRRSSQGAPQDADAWSVATPTTPSGDPGWTDPAATINASGYDGAGGDATPGYEHRPNTQGEVYRIDDPGTDDVGDDGASALESRERELVVSETPF